MEYKDMTSEDIVEHILDKYKSAGQDEQTAINSAIIAADIFMEDLSVSMEVCKDGGLHPHANGLVAGSMMSWMEIKKILEDKLSDMDKESFSCYEIHTVQARMYGCKRQCEECKQRDDEQK